MTITNRLSIIAAALALSACATGGEVVHRERFPLKTADGRSIILVCPVVTEAILSSAGVLMLHDGECVVLKVAP